MKTTIKQYGIFEPETQEQINEIIESKATEGEHIAIMPDAHYGKGICVGYTQTMTNNRIVPNFIGVDIGCGMYTIQLPEEFNISQLEMVHKTIKEHIPYGMKAHNKYQPKHLEKKEVLSNDPIYNLISKLTFFKSMSDKEILSVLNSVGSLGGGNHFIEINTDGEKHFLVIHTGSRGLGVKVAEYHQKIADSKAKESNQLKVSIKDIEPSKRQEWIQQQKLLLNAEEPEKIKYLEGEQQVNAYLNDMKIAQQYADINRLTMVKILFDKMVESKTWKTNWDESIYQFQTIHNYIDFEYNIIRKGAISAQKDELILIPLNMRDGCILATGKGNKEANYSAPHGAGRKMSREQAKRLLSLNEFKNTMKDVTSWTVNENTLDESPMAYKSKEEIIENTEELINIIKILKPVFNFKDDSKQLSYKELKGK